MTTPVGVVNTPELIRLGLSQALQPSGYEIEEVDDPVAWAAEHPAAAMVLAVRDREDVDLVVDLSARHSIVVVAMVDSISADQLRLCLSAGARACVSPDWRREDLVLAIEAGLHGMAVIPSTVARSIAGDSVHDGEFDLTQFQIDWLRDLAAGVTVRDLARRSGFSEREMYRRLRATYRTMGCSTRTEALLKATRRGMLEAT